MPKSDRFLTIFPPKVMIFFLYFTQTNLSVDCSKNIKPGSPLKFLEIQQKLQSYSNYYHYSLYAAEAPAKLQHKPEMRPGTPSGLMAPRQRPLGDARKEKK